MLAVVLFAVICYGSSHVERQYYPGYQLAEPRTNAIGVGAAAATLGDALYIVGGSGDENASPPAQLSFLFRDTRRFDILSQAWYIMQPLPFGQERAFHSLTATDFDTLYAFGGSTTSGVTNTLVKYTRSLNLWTLVTFVNGQLPPARAGHASIFLNGAIWIFGGVDASGNLLGDVWTFTPSTSTWTLRSNGGGGSAPAPRYMHAAVYGPTSQQICLWGGSESPSTLLASVSPPPPTIPCFDTSSSTWTSPISSPGAPLPTSGPYVASTSSSFFLVGGGFSNSASNPIPASASVFRWSSRTWDTPVAAPGVAYAANAVSQAGVVWIAGGVMQTTQGSNVLNNQVVALSPPQWSMTTTTCSIGYAGSNCSIPLCSNNCWGLGRCIAPDLCECIEGFQGALCEQQKCATCSTNLLLLNQPVYWPRAKTSALNCIAKLRQQIAAIRALLPLYPATCAQTYGTLPLNLTAVSKEAWVFENGPSTSLVQSTTQTLSFLQQ